MMENQRRRTRHEDTDEQGPAEERWRRVFLRVRRRPLLPEMARLLGRAGAHPTLGADRLELRGHAVDPRRQPDQEQTKQIGQNISASNTHHVDVQKRRARARLTVASAAPPASSGSYSQRRSWRPRGCPSRSPAPREPTQPPSERVRPWTRPRTRNRGQGKDDEGAFGCSPP